MRRLLGIAMAGVVLVSLSLSMYELGKRSHVEPSRPDVWYWHTAILNCCGTVHCCCVTMACCGVNRVSPGGALSRPGMHSGVASESFLEPRVTLHTATDKAVYRGGDTVFVRTYVLDAFSKQPVSSFPSADAQFIGPKVQWIIYCGDAVEQGSSFVREEEEEVAGVGVSRLQCDVDTAGVRRTPALPAP